MSQLSYCSGMLSLLIPPGNPMFQHRIEDDEEFAHANGERHLLCIPCSLQTLVEGANDGIEPEKRQVVGSFSPTLRSLSARDGCLVRCTPIESQIFEESNNVGTVSVLVLLARGFSRRARRRFHAMASGGIFI